MNVPDSLTFGPLLGTKQDVDTGMPGYVYDIQTFVELLAKAINGRLKIAYYDYDAGTAKRGNLDCVVVTGLDPTPLVGNGFYVPHNLGRIPLGYIIIAKDRACDFYSGGAATETNLLLKATVADCYYIPLVF